MRVAYSVNDKTQYMRQQFFGAYRLPCAVLFAMMVILLVPQPVRANDYMEHPENYQVYASGIDKIHFSIPVWVHGAWYERSYSALPGSHFTYKVGTGDEVTVLN